MSATANQMWKEYVAGGGELNFKDWISSEKKRSFLNATGTSQPPINRQLTDSIQQSVEQLRAEGGYQDKISDDYILGIPKKHLVTAGLIVSTAIIGYIIYKQSD